jgi:hypothetical protein
MATKSSAPVPNPTPAPKPAPVPAPTPPAVRQCQVASSPFFGAVAVAAGTNRWGVMNPANGGHWAQDSEVAAWTVLK